MLLSGPALGVAAQLADGCKVGFVPWDLHVCTRVKWRPSLADRSARRHLRARRRRGSRPCCLATDSLLHLFFAGPRGGLALCWRVLSVSYRECSSITGATVCLVLPGREQRTFRRPGRPNDRRPFLLCDMWHLTVIGLSFLWLLSKELGNLNEISKTSKWIPKYA